MKKEDIQALFRSYEDAVCMIDGTECWSARELQKLLGYSLWQNFSNVINKAKDACINVGNDVNDHFIDVNKMVELGSGAHRVVDDIMLTRYACYLVAQNGDILVQKAPACTIQTQAEAVVELFKHQYGETLNLSNSSNPLNPDGPEIKVIGIRHGEKMYETLLTKEEAAKAEDMGNFYRVPADNRDLNYDKYFKEGDAKRATIEEFNSNNTKRLNLEETKAKIASLEYIQNELNGIPNIVK